MDSTPAEPQAEQRKVPMWVWDVIGIAFFVFVWLYTARQDLAEATRTGETFHVSWAIPALVLLYVSYRVGRRLIKGHAYPEKKPEQHRSFSLTSKR